MDINSEVLENIPETRLDIWHLTSLCITSISLGLPVETWCLQSLRHLRIEVEMDISYHPRGCFSPFSKPSALNYMHSTIGTHSSNPECTHRVGKQFPKSSIYRSPTTG
jgi:hypothetical protein